MPANSRGARLIKPCPAADCQVAERRPRQSSAASGAVLTGAIRPPFSDFRLKNKMIRAMRERQHSREALRGAYGEDNRKSDIRRRLEHSRFDVKGEYNPVAAPLVRLVAVSGDKPLLHLPSFQAGTQQHGNVELEFRPDRVRLVGIPRACSRR